MSEKLYELTQELMSLNQLDALDTADSEKSPAELLQLQHDLDTLNLKFIDKVADIVKLVKNMEAQRDAIAFEAKRLSDRKRAFENRIEWLKNYVKSSMQAAQSEKIKYALFTIYVAKSQPSVEVADISELEDQFVKIKREPDKSKILEQVKSTGVIPKGVDIVQGTHLVIR
jgi:spore cortex formation protein SpoVR/YcgB (stage V sporulation)